MGRFGRKDAPRVVGFDFGPPAGAPPAAAAPEPAAPPAPPAPVVPEQPAQPATEPSPFAEVAAAFETVVAAPPPPAAPPAYAPPPGYPAYPPPPGPPLAYAPPATAPLAYAPPATAPLPYAPPPAVGAASAAPAEPWAVTAVAAPAPYAPYAPGVELMPPGAPAAKRGLSVPRGGVVVVRLVIALVVGAGGWQGVTRVFASPLPTPATLGGVPRDESAQAKQVADSIKGSIGKVPAETVAIYSSNGVPVYMLLAGDANDKSSAAMYDQLADEAGKDQATIAPAQTFGTITCTTMSSPDGAFSICMWAGKKSDGFVMMFGEGSLPKLAEVADEARTAVQA